MSSRVESVENNRQTNDHSEPELIVASWPETGPACTVACGVLVVPIVEVVVCEVVDEVLEASAIEYVADVKGAAVKSSVDVEVRSCGQLVPGVQQPSDPSLRI